MESYLGHRWSGSGVRARLMDGLTFIQKIRDERENHPPFGNMFRLQLAFAAAFALIALPQVTSAQASPYDRWPQYSPDGRAIAFLSNRDGFSAIYVMAADGTRLRRISSTLQAGSSYSSVRWMPNGDLLYSVYSPASLSGGNGDLAAIEFLAAGPNFTNARILFQGINIDRPSAAPSGSMLAFEAEHGPYSSNPNIDIEKVDLASLTVTALTHNDGEYVQASWSPDSSRIAYACSRERNASALQICVVNADGSGAHEITHSGGSHEWPAWSPDSKRLAYFLETKKEGKLDSIIGMVNADGSDERAITEHAGVERDETPSWSPDGRKIAFQTDRLGKGFRIATMRADGSDVEMLTK